MQLNPSASGSAQDTSSTATEGTRVPKIKSILAATDLSARSDRALARAINLASQLEANLTVVHVIDNDLPARIHKQLLSTAQTEIDDCLTRLNVPKGLEVNTHVLSGTSEQDILGTADAAQADVIVMGLHRNESGARPLTGTTLERVIRTGNRPVLVVKDPVEAPYASTLVATDFSIHARLGLRFADALAPTSSLHLIHAFHVPFIGLHPGESIRDDVKAAHEAELKQFADEEMAHLVYGTLSSNSARPAPAMKAVAGDVRGVIHGEIERLNPDLLVLGTHSRTGIAHMVLGSVAVDFLNRPPCDVLAVKAW